MGFDTRTESSRWCCTYSTSEGSVPGCDVGCGILWDTKYHLHRTPTNLTHNPHTNTSTFYTPSHEFSVPVPCACPPPQRVHRAVPSTTIHHHHPRAPVLHRTTTTPTHQATPPPLKSSRRRHANCQNLQQWVHDGARSAARRELLPHRVADTFGRVQFCGHERGLDEAIPAWTYTRSG